MADLKVFVDDLENELTCSICHEILQDPKTLQCLHNYCSKCIKDWYETCSLQQREFICPTCNFGFDLPGGDISKLRSSFYLGSLLQLLHAMKSKSDQQRKDLPECVNCEKSLVLIAFCPQCNGLICEDCINAHKKIKQLRNEHHTMMLKEFTQENVSNYIKNQMLCKKKFHEKNKLEYFCKEKNCRQCICQKCATLYHQNHHMLSLEEASEEIKASMEQDMHRVSQLTEKYKEELKRSMQNAERIQIEIDLAKQQVHNTADDFVKKVRKHEAKMIETLDQILLEQIKTAKDEQIDIDSGINPLCEFKKHWQSIKERNVACEILESDEAIKQRCEALLDTLTVLLSKSLQHNVTFFYSVNAEVLESMQDIGKIVKSVADSLSCTIEAVKDIRCGFINEFHIITRDENAQLCYTREDSIDVKINDAGGNEVETKVVDKQTGKYRLSYKAEKPGLYKIEVNVNGEPIRNSPKYATTLDYKTEFKLLKIFSAKGNGKGQLDKPTAMSLSCHGEIAIAECNNHRVQMFGLDGKHLREFSQGESPLFKPFGAVVNEDKIIVIDQPENHGRIQVFDLIGTYIKTIFIPEEWFKPGAMCTTDKKNIAVSCWGNEDLGIKPSVKIFNNQGDLVFEFPVSLGNDEQPCYIAYGNGKYFISYFKKEFIAVFNKNGDFVTKFGTKGTKYGQFNGISGLEIFGRDMIIVCDVKNHRVQLLTQDGQFKRSFGGFADGMLSPADVVVTADGQVFVLDVEANNVQVWS